MLKRLLVAMLFLGSLSATAADMPRLQREGDRYTLNVDGRPFFLLGAQVGNSSGWPDRLSTLWPLAAQMHVNTLEVPVYWEQIEPKEGVFDDSVVDAVLQQAREHHVHLVLLWFGTWKNGKMHYVPEWVKQDSARFPRMAGRDGRPIDVLSANAAANRDADAAGFAHLMQHLKKVDGAAHTVIMMQVENEAGALGAVRDFSAIAQKQFASAVPAGIAAALHKTSGTWAQVFGEDAEEAFQAYSVASYINAVAAAGKKEMALPMYVNNWLKSPRGFPITTAPGEDYPSGGPTVNMLDMWKAAAPAIDILAPDIYVPNTGRYQAVMQGFHRADNPLLVPETQGFGSFGGSQGNARNLFLAIGAGAIGFAPFGLDNYRPERDGKTDYEQTSLAENNRLVGGMEAEVAALQFAGTVQTAVEEPGLSQIELYFGGWSAVVSFPPVYTASADTAGLSATASMKMGRVLIAPIGPNEFLVAGIDARVAFRQASAGKKQSEFLRVEEGTYDGTTWKPGRIWNGDETDSGLNFKSPGNMIHVKLGTY